MSKWNRYNSKMYFSLIDCYLHAYMHMNIDAQIPKLYILFSPV